MTVIHPVVDRWLVLVPIFQNIPRLDIFIVVVWYDFLTKTPDVVNSPQGFSIIVEIFEL